MSTSPHHRVDPETLTFVDRLVKVEPALEPILSEHRRLTGEVLPHVFMGDVTRWFMQQHASGELARIAALARWLDEKYERGGGGVRNVIAVSFLENLTWPPESGSDVGGILGPTLGVELQHMRNWRSK